MAVFKTECDAAMARIKEYEARQGQVPHPYDASTRHTRNADMATVARYFMQYPDPHDQAGFWQKEAAVQADIVNGLKARVEHLEEVNETAQHRYAQKGREHAAALKRISEDVAAMKELRESVSKLEHKLKMEANGKQEVIANLREANKQLEEANTANDHWCACYSATMDALAGHPDYLSVAKKENGRPPRIIEVLVKRLLAGQVNGFSNWNNALDALKRHPDYNEVMHGARSIWEGADILIKRMLAGRENTEKNMAQKDEVIRVLTKDLESARAKMGHSITVYSSNDVPFLKLLNVVKDADSYLSGSRNNSVCSDSLLHRRLKEAIKEIESMPAEGQVDYESKNFKAGANHNLQTLIKSIDMILTGQDDGTGVCTQPWEETRRKLLALKSENFQIRHQAEGAKMACDGLKKRIADLEADLESLRPIAEKHPVAQLKHIGLLEIATAVLQVYNGRLLETELPNNLPPEWQSPEWAGIHQAIQTTKSYCLPHSSIYVALDRLEKVIQSQFSRYKDQADRLTSESLSKDSKISDLQAKYLQARNNEEAAQRQVTNSEATRHQAAAWQAVCATLRGTPEYEARIKEATGAELAVLAIKDLIKNAAAAKQLDKVLGQRNALENELNQVKATLAKRPGHWTRLFGIAHDIVRHVNANSKNCIIKGSDSIKALECLFAEIEGNATTAPQQPKGLFTKYTIGKADGSPVDPNAVYFVLRLDNNGKDAQHAVACRYAARRYAELVKDHPHLAKLSEELMALTSRLAVVPRPAPDAPKAESENCGAKCSGPALSVAQVISTAALPFDPFDYPIFHNPTEAMRQKIVEAKDGEVVAVTHHLPQAIERAFTQLRSVIIRGSQDDRTLQAIENYTRHTTLKAKQYARELPGTPYVAYEAVKAMIVEESVRAHTELSNVGFMTPAAVVDKRRKEIDETNSRLLAGLDRLMVNPLHPASPAPLLAAAKAIVDFLDKYPAWKIESGSSYHHGLKRAVQAAEKGAEPQSRVPVNAALLQIAGEIVDYFTRNPNGVLASTSIFANRLKRAVEEAKQQKPEAVPSQHLQTFTMIRKAVEAAVNFLDANGTVWTGSTIHVGLSAVLAEAEKLAKEAQQADTAQQASLHRLYADMLNEMAGKIRRDFIRAESHRSHPLDLQRWVESNVRDMVKWAEKQAEAAKRQAFLS